MSGLSITSDLLGAQAQVLLDMECVEHYLWAVSDITAPLDHCNDSWHGSYKGPNGLSPHTSSH